MWDITNTDVTPKHFLLRVLLVRVRSDG
uniref:Uncharacterized protein n=1 Tax=Vitis vinifera TaxID=29760 RepID=F6HUB9_VITVI